MSILAPIQVALATGSVIVLKPGLVLSPVYRHF